MNARCEELAKILDAEREKLTIEEPMDSKRLRLGLMDPDVYKRQNTLMEMMIPISSLRTKQRNRPKSRSSVPRALNRSEAVTELMEMIDARIRNRRPRP